MAKQVKQKPIEAKEEKVFNSEEIELQGKENGDSDYIEVKEQIEEVKPKEVFNEAKSVDDLYQMLCEMHAESETLQHKAALDLGLIPTQLQVVTTQLNICKNNIARALDK